METDEATTGCLTDCDLGHSRCSCAPAEYAEPSAQCISLHQPSSSACQSTIIHSLEKFSIASSTVNQSNHRNQQYSVIALTDDTGAIIERYSYTAYGDIAFFDGSGSVISNSQISNRYTYTGREYDSVIRLYHYRARMYDPQLGRFLGRDPIGTELLLGASAYIAMGPNQVDPSGEIIIISPNAPLTNGGCGGSVSQAYTYQFSQASPCFGFMVQQVSVCCMYDRCSPHCPGLVLEEITCKSYWEVWRVNRGAVNPVSIGNYSDGLAFTPITGNCGYYFTETESRLYCDKADYRNDPSDRQGGINYPNWTKPIGKLKIYGKCTATSGILPGSASEPAFWSKNPATVLHQGRRGAFVHWECCPRSGGFVNVETWSTRK